MSKGFPSPSLITMGSGPSASTTVLKPFTCSDKGAEGRGKTVEALMGHHGANGSDEQYKFEVIAPSTSLTYLKTDHLSVPSGRHQPTA